MGRKVFTFAELGEIRDQARRAFKESGKYPKILVLTNGREVAYEDYVILMPEASQ